MKSLEQVKKHCSEIMNSNRQCIYFHTYERSERIAKRAKQIAAASKLTKEELEIILIAVWIYPLGFYYSYNHHNSESIQIATGFLNGINYNKSKTQKVINCISAINNNQQLHSISEKITHDAFLFYTSTKNFVNENELLREEIEENLGFKYTDKVWYQTSLKTPLLQSFQTPFAQYYLKKGKNSNISRVISLIAKNIFISDNN